MDGAVNNPQHYQPLSHALNPPFPTARSRSPYAASAYDAQHQQHQHQPPVDQQTVDHRDGPADTSGRPEEEEEEEEEEEVEGAVAHPTTAAASATNEVDAQTIAPNASPSNAVPPRRKPGRPKGSKNKKPRFDLTATPPKVPPFSAAGPFYGYPPPPPGSVPMQAHPPAHPVAVPPPNPFPADSNNSQFYDFQWRVLTLCSEFYNAADELIRSAPPHIIAQCFSLPSGHIDPISILHEARRACDQLMANPSQTVLKPPAAGTTFTSATPPKPAGSTAPTPTPAAVITNPGSFVMSLSAPPASSSPAAGAPPAYNAAAFPPAGRYPTTSYYAYATTTHTASPGAHPYMAQQQVMKPVNLSTPAAAGNQGAWSDDETEKLRKLAEESRTQGTGTEHGEIDWDWVCSAWGPGRTRHQILIKATNIGMKESSTRGVKRRRETDQHAPATTEVANTSANEPALTGTAATQQVLNAVSSTGTVSSTANATPDRPASTALSSQAASPVVANQQTPAPVPAPVAPQPPGGGTVMQWPMPHVAANTPSPVISSATTRSVFYQDSRSSRK